MSVLLNRLRESSRVLQQLLQPPQCLRCEAHVVSGLCESCLAALPLRDPVSLSPSQTVYAAMAYDPLVKAWLYRLKFHDDARTARALTQLVQAYIQPRWPSGSAHWSADTVMLGIPSHQGHAAVSQIFAPLAAQLGIRFFSEAFLWKGNAPAQHELPSRQARVQNVAGQLILNPDYLPALQGVQQIWVVDDLITTGSTMQAAFAALSGLPQSTPTPTPPMGLAVMQVPFRLR